MHTINGYAPDWFVQGLREYFENFIPAYALRYLHQDVVIEPAGLATDVFVPKESWLDYLMNARTQTTTGFDSLILITDAPFRAISHGNIAGTNYYLAKPNFAWTSVRNWAEVDRLIEESSEFYQGMPPYIRRRYALMYGDPQDPGIRALTVAGHEIAHYLLLKKGGPELSAQIDGGYLSGITFLDEALNEVKNPEMNPPNWTWSAQRICSCLSCKSNLGAYSCSMPFMIEQIKNVFQTRGAKVFF